MTGPENPNRVGRRAVLAGAAAAVVGWNMSGGGWVTSATAAGVSGLAAVPPLDGRLEADSAGFRTDFGRLLERAPRAVLRGGTENDVSKLLAYAQQNRIPIAANGQSGEAGEHESHSNYGQALARGGLQIDMSAFRGVRSIGTRSAVVGAGTSWAELLTAALDRGRTLATLPDYLHLSIGGTVAVGGIGGGVLHAGLQSDLVRSARVVTGRGKVLQGSDNDVLDLVRGACGQYAVATELEIALVPARSTAHVTSLHYPRLSDFLADQQRVRREKLFQHQSGEIVRTPDGRGWEYRMELGRYQDSEATDPAVQRILDGLHDDAARRTSTPIPYREWVFRVDAFVAQLREAGFLSQAKPWLSLLLPGAVAERFVEELVEGLTPADIGGGFCLLAPIDSRAIKTSNFVLPPGQGYFLDLLTFPEPGSTDVSRLLERNRRLYDRLVRLGGKRYVIGAIPDMTPAQWRRHFGGLYGELQHRKRRHDPAGVLTPGQGFFG